MRSTRGCGSEPVAEYGPDTYGNRAAEFYDAWVASRVDHTTEPAAAFLAELAGDGTALELGIGTGRIARNQRVSTTRVETDRVQLDAAHYDPVEQKVTSQHILIGKEGIVLLPVQLRFAWPSELDLMARLAGLKLEARFGGWQGEAFTAASVSHVSVYTRPLSS